MDDKKGIFETISSKIGKTAEKITDTTEKIGNIGSNIKESLLDYIPEMNVDFIEDKLTTLGYSVPKVEIKLSLPPAISLEIDLDRSVIDQCAKEKIQNDINYETEENENNKILVKILQGLDYAAKVNDKVKFKNKKLSRVLIEGSIIPTVKLIYLDQNVNADIYLRDRNIEK